ncbi:hypothetical protein K4L44_03515 [Halosquirtibacter laminarini]|uniref:Uncharacterized protein n=1 Tax=Halosquirtibacter laminarini TaxID=3374600 RepID=A0AC61NHB3_9BACT|nr:hypothetical protein K4L44_03515 [Prolixibacteraceae bacterium]
MDSSISIYWMGGLSIIPCIVVAVVAVYSMKSTIKKERESREFELKLKNREGMVSYRLQAYERLALFLERITPDALILRVSPTGKNVFHYQRELLLSLRSELDHNLSQQVYITSEVWGYVRLAKERMSMLVNEAASGLSPEMPAERLRDEIFELYSEQEDQPIQTALDALKREVGINF